MSWSEDRGHCYVSQFERLAFREDEVLLRSVLVCLLILVRRRIGGIDQIPICGRGPDFRTVLILKILRSSKVIRVAVAEEDVFDFCQIQAELLQSGNENRFDSVRIAGI